jgi:ABC-type amino acid transport substrate-binding protein
MSRKFLSVSVFLIVLALLAAACGSDPSPTTAPQSAPTEAPAAGGGAEGGAGGETGGGAAGGGEPQTVVETVIVTVEVPSGTPQVQVEVAQAPGFGETLQAVQARGNLICGVNGQLPAFSFLDPQGSYSGFDADFCRALAAAIFGDVTKVEFRPLNTQERFTALQTGEIDVLMRNTTWSLIRDTELGLNFTAVTFYDVLRRPGHHGSE